MDGSSDSEDVNVVTTIRTLAILVGRCIFLVKVGAGPLKLLDIRLRLFGCSFYRSANGSSNCFHTQRVGEYVGLSSSTLCIAPSCVFHFICILTYTEPYKHF